MQSHTFQFTAATTQESMDNAVRVLREIEGVGNAMSSRLRNEVSVQCDADRASRQSLQAALSSAGYAVQTGGNVGCGGGGGGCSCS